MATNPKEQQKQIWDIYNQDDFIDAKDNQGDWRVGYIITKYDHLKTYKVRFDGWSSKYDQTFKANSYKLKPFRTEVIGYTGQMQNPGLRDQWKFSPHQHNQRTQKARTVFDQSQEHSVHQLNQILRGHNYLYTDFLMTTKFQSSQGLIQAIQYFQMNVQHLGQYLKTINDNFEEYFGVIGDAKAIQNWSSREAYFKAYYEVFDTSYTIWGNYSRLQGFFKENGQFIKDHLEDEGSKKQAKKMLQNHMTQIFLKQNGFDLVASIVDKLADYPEMVPFLFLQSFTSLLKAVYSCIGHQEKEGLIEKIIKIGDNNLKRIKQGHLKELQKHHVSNFLGVLVHFSHKTSFQEGIDEWTAERELQLALKFIVCPYFQKKLNGITFMVNVLQKNDFVLKNQFFKKWTQEKNLYQILFMNNDNPQLIKKACELAKYLYIKGNLSQQNIDLILQSRTGKHETVLKQIYSLIAEFALYQGSTQQKKALFGKVSTLSQEHWDEDYIFFIRQFSENAYGLNMRQKLIDPFGFDMVYQYALKVESQFALGQLLHILHRVQKSKIYNQFQQSCFESIQNKHNILLHIKILLMICNNRIDTFDQLSTDMISILTQCIIEHVQSQGCGVVEHGLELLTQVTRNTNKEVDVDTTVVLWRKLMPSKNREVFIKWLYKKKDNGRVILNHALFQEHKKHLLNQLWNSPEEMKGMTEGEVVFAIELFKTVNIMEHKMSRFSVVIRPRSFQLIAYDKLWSIVRETQSEGVAGLVCDLLAEVHSCYVEDKLPQAIEAIVEQIAENIKVEMLKGESVVFLTRMLQLADKLIARDEQVFKLASSPRMNYYREYTVLNRENGESKTYRFNCMALFYDFKKMLSEKHSIPLYKLLVFNSKGDQIRLQSYFKSMNELMLSSSKFQIMYDEEYESMVKGSLNRRLDLFFGLLDDQRISKMVWNIVEKLPISDDLKFKLVETEDLIAELSSVGFYKELYQMKVVLQLPDEWWGKFVTSATFGQLFKNFSKISYKTHIELEYIETLSQILGKMLMISSKEDKNIDIPDNMMLKMFQHMRTLLLSLQKEGSKNVDSEVQIIKNMFNIIECLNLFSVSSIASQLMSFKECEDLLVLGLIKLPLMELRKVFYEESKGVFGVIDVEVVQQYLQVLLVRMLNQVVALPNDKQLKEYFMFSSYFLSMVDDKNIQLFKQGSGKGLCPKIFQLVQQQQAEKTVQSPNILLIGLISLLKYFVAGEETQIQEDISNYTVERCLFADGQSICKTKSSRSQSFNLLRILMCKNTVILSKVCASIMALHRKGQWRTKRLDDWTISLMDKMKSSTGYVGLKNLGCICYMNSFMQQIFMIPRFRSMLTSCRENNFISEFKEQNVLYQVQKMFLSLWQSDKKYYNPKQFCHAFKDYQGNPTNVTEQMDIDEFSGILFDRLQNQMKESNRPTLIKDMFGGVFSNEIVGKSCPHYSQTEQPFYSISLTVKNKKNIYQSFDTMIKGDTLDGDNAYFCERCSKKVSAVKRVSLKKLPDYLIVTLKRFEFDYVNMMKLKVNDYCQFPTHLNLKEYSRQHLRRQESDKALEEEQELPPEYFSYVLKGVVVHLGYADSGHYYSFIQDRDSSKWFQFNDTMVRNFNFDDIAEEAYGGETTGYDSKEKIKNAYMLIYEREKKLGEEGMLPSKETIAGEEYNQPIMEEIVGDNKEHKIQNILFSKEYYWFVRQLMDSLDQFGPEQRRSLLKYIITVFLTITLREKSDGLIHTLLKQIDYNVRKDEEMKEWVVSLFSEKRVFQEFFKNCILRQVKKTIAYWLVQMAMKCHKQCQEYFCNMILNRITEENDNTMECCLMLYELARKSPKMLDYLVSKGMVGRFVENTVRKSPRVFVEKLEILPEGESQIGNQIVFDKPESENQKKMKFDCENGYVWALINMTIARAKQLEVPLGEYLSETEVNYLRIPQPKIMKILEQTRNKFQMYEFINFLCYLSISNKDFILAMSKNILQGIKDFQSKRYRQFFILYQKLINVQDQFSELRIQGFRDLQVGLIHNQKYSLDSNIIQQWIIILVNRNKNLRQYLQKDRQVCNFLMKAATKKIPSDEIARKNSSYGDFMINKLHGLKFPKNKKGYQKLSQDMASFYQDIIQDRFEQSHIWPSVPETEIAEIKQGDMVAYFDTKDKVDYEQANVTSVCLSRLQLQLKKNRSIYVWKDDEKLSVDLKFIHQQEQNELNSSRTTEMEVQDDDDYFDQL